MPPPTLRIRFAYVERRSLFGAHHLKSRAYALPLQKVEELLKTYVFPSGLADFRRLGFPSGLVAGDSTTIAVEVNPNPQVMALNSMAEFVSGRTAGTIIGLIVPDADDALEVGGKLGITRKDMQ